MGQYDRYKMTLRGADDRAMTAPETVEIWFLGAPDREVFEGEIDEYWGNYNNDTAAYRTEWPIRCQPFGYTDESIEGHDRARLAQLRKVLRKRFKDISAVSGPDVVAADGVSQYWAVELAGGPIPVYVSSYEESNPYDGTTMVEMTLNRRTAS